METTAVNCHAENQEVDEWQFKAGSDAKQVNKKRLRKHKYMNNLVSVKQVTWLEIASSLKLYASHIDLIELVAKHHGAHW